MVNNLAPTLLSEVFTLLNLATRFSILLVFKLEIK